MHTVYSTEATKYVDAEDVFVDALTCTITYMASYYAASDSITRGSKNSRSQKQMQKKPLPADRCASLFRNLYSFGLLRKRLLQVLNDETLHRRVVNEFKDIFEGI